MGKALLFLVLGASIILTRQLASTQEGEHKTADDQRAYQEQLIAREIAASAFNVGMGEIRAFGEDLQDGVRALNGADNAGRAGTHATGRFSGGRYTVRAELTSGHSVRVIAQGLFGDAEHTMHDEYRVYVLTAREGGYVDVSFLESQAGYCSAVYYQAYTMEMPEGTTPEPIMLFPPDNRDRRTARPARLIYVDPGTQMNFFIGVDQNCSTRPDDIDGVCEARAFARDNGITLDKYDHIHHALLVEAGNLDQAQEDVWGLVEQKPGTRDRWRIGWEDIHNTSWDRPDSEDPRNSLQALKAFGYEGAGWPHADDWGYRLLEDFGDRPDFSDQVIEVGVITPNHPDFQSTVDAYRQQQEDCGETSDLPGEETEPTDESGETNKTEPDEDETGGYSDAEIEYARQYACDCRNGGGHPILHRPPGNPSNEQLQCLPRQGARNHLRKHNDVALECRRRR